MNICSTCQGAQSECQERLDANAEYRAHVNETLVGRGPDLREGPHEQELPVAAGRGDRPRRAALARQAPADRPQGRPVLRLLHRAPGRPPRHRPTSTRATPTSRQVIEALGGTVIEYAGSHKCCGFPIITMNKEASLKQAGRHLGDAVDADADCLVTPCPLCHLNLDLQQPLAERTVGPRARHAGPAPPPARRPRPRPRAQGARAASATSSSRRAVIDWTTSVVGRRRGAPPSRRRRGRGAVRVAPWRRARQGLGRWFPALALVRRTRGAALRRDVVAGVVLAALLVPQGMAYAELAGLPPVTGLYATLVPLVVYFLLGPSPILVLGPDSAVAPARRRRDRPAGGGRRRVRADRPRRPARHRRRRRSCSPAGWRASASSPSCCRCPCASATSWASP